MFVLSCASGGMYKSRPCDNLHGSARDDCLRYLPASSRGAQEEKDDSKYLLTQEGFERTLQTIDDATESMIDAVSY
jgi:hypothetical protein